MGEKQASREMAGSSSRMDYQNTAGLSTCLTDAEGEGRRGHSSMAMPCGRMVLHSRKGEAGLEMTVPTG